MAVTVSKSGNRITYRVYDSRIATWGEPGGMTYEWIRDHAERVEKRARRLAPVMSGRLASSIRSSVTPLGKNGSIATVRATTPYALFVHEGTGLYGPEHSMIVSTSPSGFVFSSTKWPQWTPGPTGHVPKTFRFFEHRGQKGVAFLSDALEEEFLT